MSLKLFNVYSACGKTSSSTNETYFSIFLYIIIKIIYKIIPYTKSFSKLESKSNNSFIINTGKINNWENPTNSDISTFLYMIMKVVVEYIPMNIPVNIQYIM